MDVIWKIVGYGAIPFLMACIGNHLAVASVLDPKKRRMYRLWFWTVTAVGIAIISGVEVTSDRSHKAEVQDQHDAFTTLRTTLTRTEIQNAGDMGYLKAKLEDALNRPQASPLDYSKLGTALAKANMDLIQKESQHLNNKQLVQGAIEIAKKMRELEIRYHQKTDQLTDRLFRNPPTPATSSDITNGLQAIRYEEELEFRNSLLGQATYFRDELLRRLPPQPVIPQQEMRTLAFRGILAGPRPIADAADYLEQLARKLSQ